MAEETETQAPARVPKKVASMRFRNAEEEAEWRAVVDYRIGKGRTKDDSDFIRQMFHYLKKNPYGDFPTGR